MSQPAPTSPPDWEVRYRQRDTPWDSGRPSRELGRVLDEGFAAPCRAIELGCGTGTNALWLAQRGFTVTGVDLSATALEQARQKARAAGADIRFAQSDLRTIRLDEGPFDFLFDRGCYHCVRRGDVAEYVAAVRRLTRPGAKLLILAGNADEQSEEGMPRVHGPEMRAELSPLGAIEWLRPFRFEDAGGAEGPLGWSCGIVRGPA